MTHHDNPDIFDNGLFSRHLAILFAGFVVGMAAAYLFAGIHFDFSDELERARALGIVSLTIQEGYAKKRDIINYLATMGFPTVCAVGAWLVWARDGNRRAALAGMFAPDLPDCAKTRGWRVALVLAGCAYIVLSLDINHFHYPSYNDYMGAWPFLGEEGENLAWVQSILNGGVYGKDIHCLYGPMLIYPLVWFMKLFGTTVVTARVYTYGLDLLAYGIVLVFLYKALRTKTGFVFAAACYILVFTPGHVLAPNLTYLRVALGFVPILLAYLYQERRRKALVTAAGLVLGQCVLFSQEVGICSTLAVLAMLAVMPRPERGFARFCRDAACLLAGGAVSVLPMLAYFAGKGALGAFFHNLLVHPRLLGLGFTAVAFPDLREFLHDPWKGGALFHYWVILLYIAATLYLIPLLILGRRDRETVLRMALLVFGAILFRAALARSDEYHVSFVSQPAFLLCFLFLDGALAGVRRQAARSAVVARLAAVAAILAALVLLSLNSSYADVWGEAMVQLRTLPRKLSVLPYGVSLPQVPRAGIMFDPQTAESIAKIDTFLTRHTRPGEYVYFFPNEAAYYFLFDRNNPTRYVYAYFAVTRDQRLELIADLERKRPAYVVYSRNTWRMDEIPETVQVPEVVNYLGHTYHPVEDYGDVVVLQRNAP